LSLPAPVRLTGKKPERVQDCGDDLPSMLRRRRVELGVFQREAAAWLGMSEFTLGNWEAGTTAPVDRCYPALIQYFGREPWMSIPGRLAVGNVAKGCRRSDHCRRS
jgi:DNA-binding XRE family transcriptional regulator